MTSPAGVKSAVYWMQEREAVDWHRKDRRRRRAKQISSCAACELKHHAPKIHSHQGYWIKKLIGDCRANIRLTGRSTTVDVFIVFLSSMQRACWHENCFLPKRHNALAKLIPDWIVNAGDERARWTYLFLQHDAIRAQVHMNHCSRSINLHCQTSRKVCALVKHITHIEIERETHSMREWWTFPTLGDRCAHCWFHIRYRQPASHTMLSVPWG
jgi:hypothetical protein